MPPYGPIVYIRFSELVCQCTSGSGLSVYITFSELVCQCTSGSGLSMYICCSELSCLVEREKLEKKANVLKYSWRCDYSLIINVVISRVLPIFAATLELTLSLQADILCRLRS